jgi:arogenate dehydrogenase (NADP+)
MRKVGIIGLGLIGGSLALELGEQGWQVLGVSRQAKTCQIALEKGIVHQSSTNLSLLQTAEIIFICTPLAAIIPTLEDLIPYLNNPQTIITDVGSVKAPIVNQCSQLWHYFVGGHPMAGTAEQGIEAAQKNLFVGTSYVITPTEKTPLEAVEKLAKIALSLGSNVHYCTPEIHDRAVAWISHLPVFISAGLIDACLGEKDPQVITLAKKLASSGFRDTSRVGGGNPELGVMMAKYNRESLLRSLYDYRQHLDYFIELIESQQWESLDKKLQQMQQERPTFLG